MKFLCLLFSFICLLNGRIVAQTNFSDAFYNITKSNHLLIPSNTCIENNFQLDFAYRTYLGKLSIIKSYYSDVNFNLRKQKQKSGSKFSKHILGFGVYKDEEGAFFSKIRLSSNYALHKKLNSKLSWATGAKVYFVNYTFDASSTGASGSDGTFTGCVSSSLYTSTFKFGVSINDFNNSTLRPISYDFTLNRFLTFYGEKTFDVDQSTEFKVASRFNYISEQRNSAILQGGFVFSKVASASAFYYYNKGWGLIFDIQRIEFSDTKLDCSFSVLLPNQHTQPNMNQIEINLHYYLPSKK
jgi:hypothetical protein